MLEVGSKPETNLEDLDWLVENRSSNQKSTLALYKLFIEHKDRIAENKRFRASAQTLLGTAFSLWRAVFLADIKQVKGSMIADVEGFCLELIRNNAITYTQDQKHNSWTFRYYMQNANDRLKTVHKAFAYFDKKFDLPGGSMGMLPKPWWVAHQKSLDDAVAVFEALLTTPQPISRKPRSARASRAANSN